MYTVYSKENCPHCVRAITLLETYSLEYNVLKLGEDVDLEEFKRDNPNVRSVPYILFNEEVIGGYDELSRRLSDSGSGC